MISLIYKVEVLYILDKGKEQCYRHTPLCRKCMNESQHTAKSAEDQGKPCNRYAVKGRSCLFIITSSSKRQKGFCMCSWRARHRKWWHSVFPLRGECRVVVTGSVFQHGAAILSAELLQRGDLINPHQYVQALTFWSRNFTFKF